MTAPCTCPAAPDGSCAHCGRIADDHHKGRCHEAAVGYDKEGRA